MLKWYRLSKHCLLILSALVKGSVLKPERENLYEKRIVEDIEQKEMEFAYLVVANRLGFNPTTLFSIARVLNTVGKNPLKNEGVVMLSDIIKNNPHLKEKPLPENTLYYMEEYMFSFVKDHIVLLQTDIALKRKAEIVLDYLVTRGSTMGYLLREEII